MKSSFSFLTLFITHPLIGFSQSSITNPSTQTIIEYEDVQEFEQKYRTIFEDQESEYEYEKSSSNVNRSEQSNTLNRTKVHNPSTSQMDSLWINELYSSDLHNEVFLDIKNYDKQSIGYNALSTETLIARLEVLNEKTPFNIEYNPILESVIKKYLKTRREALERIISKSHYYFPLFEKELDRHQIPMEIKYLAAVESALIPRIKSHVEATGLWQFMYETGKIHHLKVNSYVDERMDPLKSTKAACEYLSSLYKIFNDWGLALAAYNSGPGNVIKAIRRSKGQKNYWNIRKLPSKRNCKIPACFYCYYVFI